MSGPTLSVDVHLQPEDLGNALERDVRTGLGASPKFIPPVWFYDETGSRLFELITELPEYYPTRAERLLLERHATEIVALADPDTLVELGAGACDKSRVILDAMAAHGALDRYIPFDVSEEFLRTAAGGLVMEYQDLTVHAVVGDFHRHLDRIPRDGTRLFAFLGGTIGNLLPDERRRFLFDVNCAMEPHDFLLIGTDLVKDSSRILSAYNDAAGVTADFNRNVLQVLNDRLAATFEPNHFEHVAIWNEEEAWIEMRLRSNDAQVVTIGDLDMKVEFDKDEEILTEISAKFTESTVRRELEEADFLVDATWGGEEGEFLLALAHPYC